MVFQQCLKALAVTGNDKYKRVTLIKRKSDNKIFKPDYKFISWDILTYIAVQVRETEQFKFII